MSGSGRALGLREIAQFAYCSAARRTAREGAIERAAGRSGPFQARSPKDIEEMTAYFIASGWPEDLARELAKTPDGHRYKALGNSMAVPVMQWIGARIRKALS